MQTTDLPTTAGSLAFQGWMAKKDAFQVRRIREAGAIVMGSKSKLYVWTEADNRWSEITDLGKSGITAITRLAISPDGKWIAIVSTPAMK